MENRSGADSVAANLDQAAGEIARTAEAICDMARQTGEVVVETSRELADNASGIAGEIVDKMRDAAESVIEEQKGRAADAVERLAAFMHRTARTFDAESAPVARLAEQAAGRAEAWATQLRQRSWNELLADTEAFARRRPALYLSGSVTAGFILARLLSSSRATSRAVLPSEPPDRYVPPGETAGGGKPADRVSSGMRQASDSPRGSSSGPSNIADQEIEQ